MVGMAADMQRLGEDIVTSYDTRVKAMGALVKDTRQMLTGFTEDRKKTGGEQAKNLADFVEDLAKNVGDLLKRFHEEHKGMSEELSGALSSFVKDLAKDVGSMMKAAAKAHKEMAKNLENTLEKGEAGRLRDFAAMMGNIRQDVKGIEGYVAKKVQEFSDARADMSEELKKELAKYVAGIVSEAKKLLGGFAGERESMAASWQAMTAVMAKRRGGKPVVSAGAGVEVKTAKEAVAKPAKGKGKKRGKGKKKGMKKNEVVW